MLYHAVGNRVAFDPGILPDINATERLIDLGCTVHAVDVVALARERIGRSRFVRGISVQEAPGVVDCSTFTKWLYGKKGIWLPRRHLQQRAIGEAVDTPLPGDLLFTTGFHDVYETDPADSVGHVGVVAGDTVVHASGKRKAVIETPLKVLLDRREFRGFRRYAHQGILTVEFPNCWPVEYSDDLKWIILSRT